MFTHTFISNANHEHFLKISEKLVIDISEDWFVEYALQFSTFEQFLCNPCDIVGNYYANQIEEALRNTLGVEEIGFIQTSGNGFYLEAVSLTAEEEEKILEYL